MNKLGLIVLFIISCAGAMEDCEEKRQEDFQRQRKLKKEYEAMKQLGMQDRNDIEERRLKDCFHIFMQKMADQLGEIDQEDLW